MWDSSSRTLAEESRLAFLSQRGHRGQRVRLKVCQATTEGASETAASHRRRPKSPARSERRQRATKPIRLKRKRVRNRTKDHDKQRYRDHDMVLIEPSIGTVIGLPGCRPRSKAATCNVLDITPERWTGWPNDLRRPTGIHVFVRGPGAHRAGSTVGKRRDPWLDRTARECDAAPHRVYLRDCMTTILQK